jgi:hypothetical protein
VKSDRSGTPTSSVTETKTAYNIGPLVGIKSNLGMVIKLDTSPFDEFLDTLSGVTFNQVLFELGEIEPFADEQSQPTYLSIYFTDNTNDFLENSSGNYYTVQAEGQPQVFTNENGDQTLNVNAPARVFYDTESKQYSELITSHVNALFRGDLTRKDWLIYGGYISGKLNTSSDPFRKSLSQFVVNNNKIKVKVIYSRSR